MAIVFSYLGCGSNRFFGTRMLGEKLCTYSLCLSIVPLCKKHEGADCKASREYWMCQEDHQSGGGGRFCAEAAAAAAATTLLTATGRRPKRRKVCRSDCNTLLLDVNKCYKGSLLQPTPAPCSMYPSRYFNT